MGGASASGWAGDPRGSREGVEALAMPGPKAEGARARRKSCLGRGEPVGAVGPDPIQARLEGELERLKGKLGMGHELRVVWSPDNDSNLSGEVRGETIYIYEEELDKALETLRHEFLDYAISKVIEPYRQVCNKLIVLINEEAYRRKERLVENLGRLLCQD